MKTVGEKIFTPQDVAALCRPIRRSRQEHFGVICIDDAHRVLCKKDLFVGVSDRCLVSMKMVAWFMASHKASAVAVYHNHPSNACSPSGPDDGTTRSLCELCKVMGITFLDHVIITQDGYYSYREHERVIYDDSGCAYVSKED